MIQHRPFSTAAGFTLIELLVVMVIMGLLVALIAPNVMNQADKARPKTARVQIENFLIPGGIPRRRRAWPYYKKTVQRLLVGPALI